MEDLNNKYQQEHTALLHAEGQVEELEKNINDLERANEELSNEVITLCLQSYLHNIEHKSIYSAACSCVQRVYNKVIYAVNNLSTQCRNIHIIVTLCTLCCQCLLLFCLLNQLTEVQTKLEQKETKLDAILETLENVEMQFIEKNVEHDTVSSIEVLIVIIEHRAAFLYLFYIL